MIIYIVEINLQRHSTISSVLVTFYNVFKYNSTEVCRAAKYISYNWIKLLGSSIKLPQTYL